MILDASAIVAVALEEIDSNWILREIEEAEFAGVGAPTAAEAAIVLGRRAAFTQPWMLHRIIQKFDLHIIAFEEPHWSEALLAYERFGRGRHAARLNFGDCLTYAIAKVANEPLLCIGDDFAKTDLEVVARPEN